MSTMSELHLLGNCRKTKRYSWGTCSYDLEHNSHEQEISLGSAKNNTLEKIFKNVIFELDFAKELKKKHNSLRNNKMISPSLPTKTGQSQKT